MQTASAAFGTEVLSPDQLMAYEVIVTLPGGVQASFGDLSECVESLDWYRQETSTLPANVSLIAGYQSVQPQIVLAGLLNQGDGVEKIEGQDAFWLFNPNDPTSPMWRQGRLTLPIVIRSGLYDGSGTPELLDQFTGTIDQIACADGEVTLTCLDLWSTLTNQAMLPPVITPPPYNSGLTSEYPMDYLLRHASPAQYLSWPAQRPNCVLAVGMRSSIWPEVGSFTSSNNTPQFLPGANGSAVTGQSSIVKYTLEDPDGTPHPILPTDTSFFMEYSAGEGSEFWLQDPGGTQFVVIAYENDGNLHFFTDTASGTTTQTVALSAGIRRIEAQVHWAAGSTAVTGTLYADGVPTALSITAKDARSSSLQFTQGAASSGVTGSMAELQVSIESAGVSNGSFEPTFIIDPAGSLNALTALPDVSGKKTAAVLQDIAAAEFGVIGPDESGNFRFTNRQTIRTATSVRSITSSQSLKSLSSSEQQSLCANDIQVPVNQIQIAPYSIVWQASTPLQVNPGTPLTFIATLQNPAVNVPTRDSGRFTEASWSQQLAYWMACTTPDGLGASINSGISFTINQLSATQLQVTITNNSGVVAYMVSTDSNPGVGTPVIIIGGQSVTPTGASVTNGAAVVAGANGGLTVQATWGPGDVPLPVQASDWLQDINSGQSLATDLLSELFIPKPQYSNVSIIPDPRLQLLDRVTLVDPDVSQINDDVLIVGIDTSISNGTYTQTIDARAFFRPGAWILDQVGRSELGLTTFIY